MVRPAGRRHTTHQARLAIFDEAVQIIESEFSQRIRIEDVARRLSTSPRQLQRIFSEIGGVGFRSYLRRVRMSRATELLATADMTVKEVARSVGYDDHSQFSKAFKRTYGVSPSEARSLRRGSPERRSGRVGPSPSC